MESPVVVGVVGAFATFVDSSVGMGFGVLSNSLLLMIGVYPAIASASVHMGKILTGVISGGAHLYLGNVRKEWLLPLVLSGVVGGSLGAYALASLPGKALKPYVAVVLLGMGFLMLYRFLGRPARSSASTKSSPSPPMMNNAEARESVDSPRRLSALGFLAAFLDAIGGGSWGPITTPGLVLGGQEEPAKVIGTVNVAEVFVALAISGTFIATIGLSTIPWTLVAALLAGGAISAPVGALFCNKMPTAALGVLTALALIGINLAVILTALARWTP